MADIKAPGGDSAIQLRVERVDQLFDTLDPFPFSERDLDRKAEDYIVGWARDLPTNRPLSIIVHLPAEEATRAEAADVGNAIARHFQYCTDRKSQDLRELFRHGRYALAVGVGVLAFAILARQLAWHFVEPPGARFIEESLLIMAWVVNWRPLEIFLFDWWPILRARRLFRRLAVASVQLVPSSEKAL